MTGKHEKDKLRRIVGPNHKAFREAIAINPSKSPESMLSHLSKVFNDEKHGVLPMTSGRVARNTNSEFGNGIKGKVQSVGGKRKLVVKKDKVFSNAVPSGYTKKEWTLRLRKVFGK